MKVVFGGVFIHLIYGAPETALCSWKMGRLLRACVTHKSRKNRAGWIFFFFFLKTLLNPFFLFQADKSEPKMFVRVSVHIQAKIPRFWTDS